MGIDMWRIFEVEQLMVHPEWKWKARTLCIGAGLGDQLIGSLPFLLMRSSVSWSKSLSWNWLAIQPLIASGVQMSLWTWMARLRSGRNFWVVFLLPIVSLERKEGLWMPQTRTTPMQNNLPWFRVRRQFQRQVRAWCGSVARWRMSTWLERWSRLTRLGTSWWAALGCSRPHRAGLDWKRCLNLAGSKWCSWIRSMLNRLKSLRLKLVNLQALKRRTVAMLALCSLILMSRGLDSKCGDRLSMRAETFPMLTGLLKGPLRWCACWSRCTATVGMLDFGCSYGLGRRTLWTQTGSCMRWGASLTFYTMVPPLINWICQFLRRWKQLHDESNVSSKPTHQGLALPIGPMQSSTRAIPVLMILSPLSYDHGQQEKGRRRSSWQRLELEWRSLESFQPQLKILQQLLPMEPYLAPNQVDVDEVAVDLWRRQNPHEPWGVRALPPGLGQLHAGGWWCWAWFVSFAFLYTWFADGTSFKASSTAPFTTAPNWLWAERNTASS